MTCTQTWCQPSYLSQPVVLFITNETCGLYEDNAPLFWLTREAGFRPFVVPWYHMACQDLQMLICSRHEGQTIICGGFEALANGEKRPIYSRGEQITPQIIFHRVRMEPKLVDLYDKLAKTHPHALLSFHPELKVIGTKWGAELCFRAGEERGIHVARPETFLVPKHEMGTKLREVGKQHALIFKPAEESQGRGIKISTPETFETVLREVENASPPRFVVQKIVENAIRLEGKRFDLRLYAFVSRFRPLCYRVYRDGIAKVAAKPESEEQQDPLSILTNCAYRACRGEQVDNLTISQLLSKLHAQGYRVVNFWQQIDALVGCVFECFANWELLATAPDLSRLFLVTGLDIMLINGDDSVKPLFIESNYTPLLHNFGPPEVDEGLLRTTRQWLAALRAKCPAPVSTASIPQPAEWFRGICRVQPKLSAPLIYCSREHQVEAVSPERNKQSIRLSVHDMNQPFPSLMEVVEKIKRGVDGRIVLNGVSSLLNHVVGRQRLLDEVRTFLSDGDQVLIRAADDDLSGVELCICQNGGPPVIGVSFEANADLRSLNHPISTVLPRIGENNGTVETKPWPSAQFEYLDPDLVGPTLAGRTVTREESLLLYLGRVITKEVRGDPFGRRNVEPGVGRSFLVDFLRIDRKPDITVFSALGIGLTPYSEEGFFLKGPDIDGLCSLKKARHRQRIAEKLADAGCRVPKTAAIISLPGLEKTWPDGRKEPAAIMVRGFRISLRIQHLDPFHGFLLSDRYRPLVAAFLFDRSKRGAIGERWQGQPHLDLCRLPISDFRLQQELERLSCKQRCLRYIVADHRTSTESSAQRRARELRFKEIHLYAPLLLKMVKESVARELGRNPENEVLSDEDYVTWFAERMGEQLAFMKALRFLNDYRMARDDWTMNALSENQVSLVAEFIDLDTGIFVDSTDLDGVLLTKEQVKALQSRFDAFHAQDVEEARNIVQTLALIAYQGNIARARQAVDHFTQIYESNTSKH